MPALAIAIASRIVARRNADRAGVDLHLRDLRALVQLRVRSQSGGQRRDLLGHRGDVGASGVQVEDQRRGLDLVAAAADRGLLTLRHRHLLPLWSEFRFRRRRSHCPAPGIVTSISSSG